MEFVKGSLQKAAMNLRSQFINTIEQGKVIFLLADEDGTIDYISSYVEDILHYKQADLNGSSIYNITESESAAKLRLVFDLAKEKHETPHYFEDLGLHCTYCLRHFFDGVMVAKLFPQGIRYLIYMHDVTQRKTESEKLSLLNLELDSFIYKASHDLRAPLLSMQGLVNLLDKVVADNQEAKEYSYLLRKSIGRLDQFIGQLTHYARNNNICIENGRVNFKEMLAEIIENYKFLPNAEKIKFEIDLDQAPTSCSDSFRLKIILNNLVSNAIKFHNLLQPHPFIRLTVKGDASFFSIEVKDNGTGIAANSIEKIFGMFERASDKAQGSGLGLYIVRKALDKVGGKIKVLSDLGKGSTFIIVVPNGINNCGVEMTDNQPTNRRRAKINEMLNGFTQNHSERVYSKVAY